LATQKVGLIPALKRRGDELSVLNEVGQAISSGAVLALEDILELVYQQTSRLMDTTNLYISLYDEEENTVHFKLAIQNGERQGTAEGEWRPRRAGNGLTEYVVRSKEPLLIRARVQEWLQKHDVEGIGREAKSWLGVPMVAGNKLVGVIGVQSFTTPDAYDEDHRSALFTIAAWAAIAIQNARLLQERKLRLEQLEALCKQLEALAYQAIGLTGETTHSELSRRALVIVSELLDAEACLYVCETGNADVAKLVRCVPESFGSRLHATCTHGSSPLKQEWQAAGDPVLLLEARSREGRLEGFVLVQRTGRSEHAPAAFTASDHNTLFLLASAIGHALRNLRIDWPARP